MNSNFKQAFATAQVAPVVADTYFFRQVFPAHTISAEDRIFPSTAESRTSKAEWDGVRAVNKGSRRGGSIRAVQSDGHACHLHMYLRKPMTNFVQFCGSIIFRRCSPLI